ncbi:MULTISPECIES: hypothetical protein [Enterobacteriaceae]|uniref:Uncharacterized protein n=6 Tax=Enterobacteriaceae TaxID=543 RepID=A0A6G6APT3_KLEPN|nr:MULTISPECIES: hypothetical protein [Enterobacteriaceae]MDM9661379.1 hypothetical protein [Raoultella planticola]KAB8131366.1 hypothetical protein FNH10_19935 [Raoultella ornithinolytica]MBC4620634.1 hypothetical protein [Klebsiella pneumoniae]MBN7912808.1 hypothetical protein [Klebsiella pneumoniae]MBN8065012.1 hypothetical protein [Klebsiella pneumoniae]
MTQQHSHPREAVEMSRRIFENLISSSLNSSDTTGTCMYGSILVSMLLEKFSGVRTRIAGGDGVDDGGILTAAGMKGHYWVVANVNGMLFVVDITADQFGMDKIVYKGLKDAPEYIEGHQITIDEHVHETLHQIIGSYSSEYNQL